MQYLLGYWVKKYDMCTVLELVQCMSWGWKWIWARSIKWDSGTFWGFFENVRQIHIIYITIRWLLLFTIASRIQHLWAWENSKITSKNSWINYNFRGQQILRLPNVQTTKYGLKSRHYNAANTWNSLTNENRDLASVK